MGRRGVAIVGIGVALALWLWWPVPSGAEPEPEKFTSSSRVVKHFEPSTDPLFEQAARGNFGDDYRTRVCDLCVSGRLSGPTCSTCEPDEEGLAPGMLVVDVVDEGGRPEDRGRIWVQHCDAKRVERGVFEVGEGPCMVTAGRRDGALWARSEGVEISVSRGGEAYVQVELHSARTGGLGVSVGSAPNGIRVLAVMPGTPAAAVGLEAGDVIVEVDGQSAHALGLRGFIATMTGPEGSEVDFVVQFEDDEGQGEEAISIVRSFLDKS